MLINLTGTKQTTMSKIALDTNILVYLYDENFVAKRAIADDLIAAKPNIPAQVVSEFLNVSKRLLHISKIDLIKSVTRFLETVLFCQLHR